MWKRRKKKDYLRFLRSDCSWYENCCNASQGTNEGGRHGNDDDTYRDHRTVELAVFPASDLVRPVMQGRAFHSGGAFEPGWWIPTVRTGAIG